MMRIVWVVAVAHEKFKINGVQGLNRLFGEFTKEKVLIDVKGLYKRGLGSVKPELVAAVIIKVRF